METLQATLLGWVSGPHPMLTNASSLVLFRPALQGQGEERTDDDTE
jgi:hypothetical protein